MSTATSKPFPWWIYAVVAIVVILAALSPVISAIIAEQVAVANGCHIEEATIRSCMINGSDWGVPLYNYAMFGWMMLLSLPVGFGLLVVWLIVLLLHLNARREHKAVAP